MLWQAACIWHACTSTITDWSTKEFEREVMPTKLVCEALWFLLAREVRLNQKQENNIYARVVGQEIPLSADIPSSTQHQ